MKVSSHFNLNDSEFEKAFEKADLEPSLFDHEAHLRLAWIHVTKYGVAIACDNLRGQLNTYVKKLGQEDKYNDTVTLACAQAVSHFVQRSKAKNFNDFIREFPRLKSNMKDLLDQHYSIDIFKSADAKRKFIAPDKEPFDQVIS